MNCDHTKTKIDLCKECMRPWVCSCGAKLSAGYWSDHAKIKIEKEIVVGEPQFKGWRKWIWNRIKKQK